MLKKIFCVVFTCWMIVEVQSDTVYAVSGYAFPNGVSTSDPLGMINALQQTLESHYNMIPVNARPEAYQRAKQMFDAAAARASNYVSSVNRLPRVRQDGVVPNPISAVTGNLPSGVTAPTIPWMNNLPICLKQLLSMVQYVRKHCPLCQMVDNAMGRGGIPMDTYVIDATGNIFRQKGQELVQSNYAFDGQKLVDSTNGVTIVSLYS